jgi:uncharacterized protein
MKMTLVRLVSVIVLLSLVGTALLTGCGGEPPTPTAPPPTQNGGTTSPPTAAEYEWPPVMHVIAIGTSGVPKMASFLTPMDADTDMTIRIVPEASPAKQGILVAEGDMFCALVDKTGLGSMLEAREDFATRQGGPWPIRVLWLSDLSNAGFFVRGDSDIKTLADIGPGTRIAVWDMKESTLRWPRALLNWIQLDEKEIVWFDAGTTAGSVRAISDGRADIMFFFPISPMIFEAAAAPHGIRFIDLNSELDPEGAARLNEHIPGTTFAPIAVGPEGAVDVWGTITHKLIVTREASDTELVYNFTKWMDENYDLYKDSYATNKFMTVEMLVQALETTFIPAHEGLIKYLKEKGLWTPELEQHNQNNLEILDKLMEAYADAIKLADQAGIAVEPVNEVWIEFWEKYKVTNDIPKVAPPRMKQEEKAPVVIPPTEVEGDVTFELVSITNPAYREGELIIVATTEPGTEASIRMWFEGGRESTITFRDKDKATADADGKLVFNGLLGHTVDGVAKLEITLTNGAKTGKATVYTEITRH